MLKNAFTYMEYYEENTLVILKKKVMPLLDMPGLEKDRVRVNILSIMCDTLHSRLLVDHSFILVQQ